MLQEREAFLLPTRRRRRLVMPKGPLARA